MKIKILALLIILLGGRVLAAESGTEIEIDPIAYLLNGYSVHIGRQYGSWKYDINTAAESLNQVQTNVFLSNDNFTAKFFSYGAKIDYIGPSQTGFHVGIQWDYLQWSYSSTINGITANNYTQDAGIRFGYRLGSGSVYVDPWVGFLYNYQGTGSINVGGLNFNQQSFQIFPTLHLGVRF